MVQFFTINHVDEFTEMDLEAFKDLEYLRGFRRSLEQDLNVSPPFIVITFETCSTSSGGYSNYDPRELPGSNCPS